MRRWLFILFILTLYCNVNSWSQDVAPVFPLSGSGSEYIREWLILGPLFPNQLGTDFLASVGGEAGIEPREGEDFTTADKRKMVWKRYKSGDNVINLLGAVGNYQNAVVYAFCNIQSESTGLVRLYLGSDDGIAVWINGRQVHFHNVVRPLIPDKDALQVNLKAGKNCCLIKVSQSAGGWGFSERIDSSNPNFAVLSGLITDENSRPSPNAVVRLERDGQEIAQTRTDSLGSYNIKVYPMRGLYDLSATSSAFTSKGGQMAEAQGDLGAWRLGIKLNEGTRQRIDLTLRWAVNVEGTVLMLDGVKPHVAIPVQAVMMRAGNPEDWPAAMTLTDERGRYRFANLRPGRYYIRCSVTGKSVYYSFRGNGALIVSRATPLLVQPGKTIRDVNFWIAPFKKGNWRSYNYLNGLTSDAVSVIHRDNHGTLWIGTSGGGISRYDGKRFTNFTTADGLAGNWINAIHSDPDNTVWFGTWSGISRYDGKKFVNFTTQDGLPSNFVNAIYRDPNGIMWIGTGWTDNPGGVSRYDGKGFLNLTTQDGLANDTVLNIYRDDNGLLWFGTFGGGISRYDGKEFVNFNAQDGLASNYIISIHGGSDGALWFGTLMGGVSRYHDGKFTTFTTKNGLASNTVSSICSDTNGVLWFGTGYIDIAGGGASRYDGKTFVNFTAQDGLANNTVRSINPGKDGVIWFGTGGGISQYDADSSTNFSTEDGLADNAVRFIYRDSDGTLWFGTEGGVSRYDGSNFTNLGLISNDVRFIQRTQDGALWLATRWDGVFIYNGRRIFNLPQRDGLAHNQVLTGFSAPDGTLWFGTRHGVSRYDGSKFVNLYQRDGLPNDTVASISSDSDGALWFGTLGGGVSRYDGNTFTNFKKQDGLASNSVISIYHGSDGKLWFGTLGGGVSSYDGKGFSSFTAQEGLAHGDVAAIYRDTDGVLWFGTLGAGVSRYDGAAWSSLDTRDGLAGNKVFCIIQDPDGSFWFGTDGGVTHYRCNTVPPKLRIYSVCTSKKIHTDLTKVPLVTAGQQVTIEYSAIDYKTVPEKRQYRCRIRGIEPDWRKLTGVNQFEWKPKKFGKYVFEIQAIDRDLNYSDTASLEIMVLPFFLNIRTGLIVGAILVAFLVPTIIYTNLLKRQKKQAFEPIPNPYIVGEPIESREMFFGRMSDFEFIKMKLSSEQTGLAIVFTGERGSGKTSILMQVMNGILGERCIPVMLDMAALAAGTEADFFEKIAYEINEVLLKAGLRPVAIPDALQKGDPRHEFQNFIAQSIEILEGKTLILMFDEYEVIETKMDEGVFNPENIRLLASLLEAHKHLLYIFTGFRRLGQRDPAYWSPLVGKLLYRHISFLPQRDALHLIIEPVKDRMSFPAGIPERIIRLTAGHPLYTQLLCKNLVDRLNSLERDQVHSEDIDEVAQKLASDPPARITYFWRELGPEQQNTLSLIGESLKNSDHYVSASILLDLANKLGLELKMDQLELERILDKLIIYEILERERAGEGQYEYRFRADLLRMWVRQAYPVKIWETGK